MSRIYRVVLRPQARRDLADLGIYITREASRQVAHRYVMRLREACRTLREFPERGTMRPDLLPGLRTMGFEGRATIAFVVEGDTVRVLNIFYGGRDFEAHLRDESNLPD
jgi:toxin ParE1/3/4